MTAAAPAARAARDHSRQSVVPSAVVPATTGTRPATWERTVSRTSARSRSERRAASPVTPSAVRPSTPAARFRSITRRRLSWSTSSPGVNGVGRTEKTPSSAVIAVADRSTNSARAALRNGTARRAPREARVAPVGIALEDGVPIVARNDRPVHQQDRHRRREPHGRRVARLDHTRDRLRRSRPSGRRGAAPQARAAARRGCNRS